MVFRESSVRVSAMGVLQGSTYVPKSGINVNNILRSPVRGQARFGLWVYGFRVQP